MRFLRNFLTRKKEPGYAIVPGYALVPPSGQDYRIPAFSRRHTYGGSGTIHRTGTIDIQITPNGDIAAVWYRCLSLPFTVSQISGNSPGTNPRGDIAIEEITYADLREVE